MSYLDELASKYQPTKMEHDYLCHYADALEAHRLEIRNVVEVGVQEGNSVRMWQEYFPNALIHGLEIDARYKIHEDTRIRIWVCDSTDQAHVEDVVSRIDGEIDLVIDDGSHHPFDQIKTFKNFFPHLADGGIYFVEDVGATRGPLRLRGLHAFMELAEAINYWPRSVSAAHVASLSEFDTDNYWIRNVVGVAFFRHLVVVSKGRNRGGSHVLRKRDFDKDMVSVERPEISISRLRELPWPKFRRRRHFVGRRETKPEGSFKLLLRYAFHRW